MAERSGSDRRFGQSACEAVERSQLRIKPDRDPDPVFRRRLRGVVVNRHVAIREGMQPAPEAVRPRMGGLGRACLYASVAMAASVSGVMAVSEQAVPGDLLYPVKRETEALRFQVLPAHLHDDLHAAVLTERIDEMRRLAGAGEWAALASLTTEVGALDTTATTLAPAQASVLTGLLGQLPPPARITVEEAIYGAAPDAPGVSQLSDGDDDDGDQSAGTVTRPASTPTPSPAPTASQSRPPTPSATPSPSPTPSPTPTSTPDADDDEDDD